MSAFDKVKEVILGSSRYGHAEKNRINKKTLNAASKEISKMLKKAKNENL